MLYFKHCPYGPGTSGAGAVQVSTAIPFLRGAAYGMGFAGNVVNAWIAFRVAAKLEKEENVKLSRIMLASMVFFSIGAAPFLLIAANWLAQAAIKRGLIAAGGRVTGMLARVVAARLGTAAVGLSIPGIGWLFTAVAVGHFIYVVINMPTPLQTWLKGCYFGKPDSDTLTRKSWAEEEAALKKLQEEQEAEAKKEGVHA